MKNEKLMYRIILFLGLSVSIIVVMLFKNFERELAAAVASILFLTFGIVSGVVSKKVNDITMFTLSLGFILFSVFPIGLIKYILTGQEDLIPLFHKSGNIFFMGISILSLFRIIKLRLKENKSQ